MSSVPPKKRTSSSVDEVHVPVVPDQQLRLYEVNLSLLFKDGQDLNRKLALSLSSVSNDLFNESYLMSISADHRHIIYVLIDPFESWKEHDNPTVYCAIQVYLEGEITNPTEEDENVGNAISDTFPEYYPQLQEMSLVGARIEKLFQISDESKDGYDSTGLDFLISFYDGKETIPLIEKGALRNPQKKWDMIHYIGAYINFTANDVARWEGYHFFLFFAGKLWTPKAKDSLDEIQACVMLKLLHDFEYVSDVDERCTIPAIVQQSRYTFARHLSSIFTDVDTEFALRLFKSLKNLIQPFKVPAEPRLWLESHHENVKAFIESPEAFITSHQNFELMVKLANDFAMVYFNGRLPIDLSDDEEAILLQTGLQDRENLIQEKSDAKSNLRNILQKTLDFYNSIIPPEVADKAEDNPPESKRQKTN